MIDSDKTSDAGIVHFDFASKAYPIFSFDTMHKFGLGLTVGNLRFDNPDDEKLDQLTYRVKGTFAKINIDYENIVSFTQRVTLETKVSSQFALNNKNLDASEAFTAGGINGVKVFEEGSVYASNGVAANVEAKYALPDFHGIDNSVGIFYDYGEVWMSDEIISSVGHVSVQDAGIGFYSRYKSFFSKIQTAFEVGSADVAPKNNKRFRLLLQAGMTF